MSLKTAFAFLELSHGWKNTEDCYHFWNITKILRDCECHVFVYVLHSTVRDVNILSLFSGCEKYLSLKFSSALF